MSEDFVDNNIICRMFWKNVQFFCPIIFPLSGVLLKSLQASPVFTFANQAGLDMLETTLVALQDIMLDKVLDESGRKILCSEFSKIMQQVLGK